MIYVNELVLHKRTGFNHPQGLQIFKVPRRRKQTTLRKLLRHSIHGIDYLWEPGSSPAVRTFWLLVIVATIAACFTMYAFLAERHNKQVLTTVVETTQLPLYTLDFPAVAVCPWNHINWIRYKAAEEKFLPQNVDENVKEIFYDLLTAMERMTLTQLEPIGALAKHKSFPPAIHDIVLYDLAQFMAFRCDELFVSCVFDVTPHDCCKLFVAERTENGICLVFNSMISEDSRIKQVQDSFYPQKMRTSGEGTGLAFTLRYNKTLQRPESKVPFAFTVLIKESEEWSESIYHYMMPNTRNYFGIVPQMTEASPNTRSVDPQKRRCLFSNEKSTKYDRIPGLIFNRLNCLIRCKQNYVSRYCGCTLSMFFPTLDIFNYVKYPQQDEFMTDLRRGMICDCVDNCQSLLFLGSTNINILNNPNASIPEVQADIYIDANVITKYGTRLDYTNMDLLANFGGVLGLCLGASLLSLLTIVSRTIRLIVLWFVRKWNKNRRLTRVQNVRQTTKLRLK